MRIWFGLILTHMHKIALTYIIPFIHPKLSLFSGFIPDQFTKRKLAAIFLALGAANRAEAAGIALQKQLLKF